MKKIVLSFVAAASLMFAACESEKTDTAKQGAAVEQKAPAAADDVVMPVDPSAKLDQTFDNVNFTAQYPSSLAPKDMGGSDFYVCDENGHVVISMTYNTDGATIEQLPTLAENMTYPIKSEGFTEIGAPVVKGKKYVIRATGEVSIGYFFSVMKEDKIGLMGSFQFPKEQAGEYEKYVGAFINSIKFK